MPRPEISRRGASGNQSANPFANWLRGRKERRREAEDEASRLITNKIAENESTIIDKLNSIDFLHSRLPKSVLDAKQRPDQPYGDLEYAARGIVHMLLKNPQTIKIDIRKFDQKLMTLVLMYKQAIEQGDIRAAYAAKGALVRGFSDIRTRLPQNQPELAKQFVEANVHYLDQWITLVGLAQVADRTKQNVESQKALHDKAVGRHKEKNENLRKELQGDTDYTEAFYHIYNHDSPEERAKWTDTQREVHRMMIERRMEGVNLELNNLLVQQQELDLTAKEAQVDVLYSKVAALPIVQDPDLMNKFKESVDEIFRQLAESDADIDATLKTMDEIEGRIQQLNNAPGAIRAREVAAEEAENAVKEIMKMQNDISGKSANKAKQMREDLGIFSEEQLAQMRKEAEIEQQRIMQEMEQMMTEDNSQDEGEVLYN